MEISCDICKYGESHDYVKGNYYCRKGCFFHDRPMVSNCQDGELDKKSYNLKYKPYKEYKNVSKKLVYEELKKILWGIKLKDVDTIMEEINQLKDKVESYREPYKCATCLVTECKAYANGCSDCSGWK